MYDLTSTDLFVTLGTALLLTWGLGLTPPMIIRYWIVRRPLSRSASTWIAAGNSLFFWFSFLMLRIVWEEEARPSVAWILVFFAARWILSRRYRTDVTLEAQETSGNIGSWITLGFVVMSCAAVSILTATTTLLLPEGLISDSSPQRVEEESPAPPPVSAAPALVTPTAVVTIVNPTATRQPELIPVALVLAPGLNVRSGPGVEHAILFSEPQGTEFIVVGFNEDESWAAILLEDGSHGWISADETNIEIYEIPTDMGTAEVWRTGVARFSQPTVAPVPSRAPTRPRTGLLHTGARGSGTLYVENGAADDAIVILTNPGGAVVYAAYVRGGDSFTIDGITDNEYNLYFATGENWDEGRMMFTVNLRRQRFEESFRFSSRLGNDWEITLHEVTGGSAETGEVDETNFPVIP